MKKTPEFDNILDDCLERLHRGETIAACLAAYPEHAAALKPLLETARRTQQAVSVTPRPEFRQAAAAQFAKAVREMPAAKKRGFFFGLKPAWTTLIVVVIVLLAGGGTVGAASNSLPDSPLYPVKMATESVQLALTFSTEGKAELYASFADERVDEIIQMAAEGKITEVERATVRLGDQLLAMSGLTAPSAESGAALMESADSFLAASSPETRATPPPATQTPPATTLPPSTPPVIVTQVPAPTVTLAPAALDKAALAGLESEGSLLATVSQQALDNLQALHDALESAPESAREALLAAIAVADAGYLQVITNLE